MNYVHSPVLINEIQAILVGEQDRLFLDCTVGEGGHTEALLGKYPGLKIVALDRDKDILEIAKKRMSIYNDRFKTFNVNFVNATKIKDEINNQMFDCALIDLGISVYHYKISNKGFSFTENQKLDMRLDESGTSVFDIVNYYSYEDLRDIFFKFGEEKFSREIAKQIINERIKKNIEYSDELAKIVTNAIPPKFRSFKINPATKVFQALRIVANDEIENIKKGIPEVLSLLKKGGKLGVITFHSIEDRAVKEIFTYLAKDCICPPKIPKCVCGKVKQINILSKAIKPDEKEISLNPPSRSSKLRIVEKII